MPIKGLTDRGLSFPEIGQIRKGGYKQKITNKQGKEIEIAGKDLDYFRVEFATGEFEAMKVFADTYPGGKPAELNVVLPFNEIERLWDAWLEGYTAGRMVARTDGETYAYLVDSDTGEVIVRNGVACKTGAVTIRWNSKDGKPQSRTLNLTEGQPVYYLPGDVVGHDYKMQPIYVKQSGRLKVVLPELQRLAYFTVLTTSLYDIINLSEQLAGIASIMARTGKGLAGVPLKLRRRPKEISVPKPDGQRVRMEKWLLSIEADPEFVKRALLTLKHAALPGNGLGDVPPLLEAPYEDVEDDDDDTVTVPAMAQGLPVVVTPIPAEVTPAPAPATTATATRPYPPEVLREKLNGMTANGWEMSPEMQGIVVNIVETTVGGSRQWQELTEYLFGRKSGEQLSTNQWYSLYRCLSLTKDKETGQWIPDAYGIEELRQAHTEALRAKGPDALMRMA